MIIKDYLFHANIQAVVGICAAPNGGYLWYGQVRDPLVGNKLRGFMLQTDPEGNEQWRRFFDSPTTGWVYSVALDSSGAYRYYRAHVSPYHYICTLGKLDALGNTIWEMPPDSVGRYPDPAFMISLKNGDSALGFQEDLHCPLFFDEYNCIPASVRRFDPQGNLLWKWVRYDDNQHRRYIRSLAEKENGEIVGGGFMLDSVSHNFGWLFALSPDGQLLWEREMSYDFDNWKAFAIFTVAIAENGDIIGAGDGEGDSPDPFTTNDGWVFRTGPDGCFTPGCGVQTIFTVDVAQPEEEKGNIVLMPNPAQRELNVVGLPPGQSNVLCLLDGQGRLLLEKTASGGSASLFVEALPGGVYFMQIRLENGRVVNKKVIVQH